jgi:hypothetical protein
MKLAMVELAVDLVDGVLQADAGQAAAIGQARHVPEHVAEVDRPARRLGDHIGAFARHPDPVALP